ncbi:methyltransferase domain-containing protein [Aetokthonos hydrillicola Thurmond2011]|jgi:SAM-dependent methyltransferase|uniref:Methyltransferase domain-containing protein n=1 Tax=Aetokthonos hydrillicola Thurmond2011 TaxID=2712845 RepID=A0AAP5IEX1_9CYAN|nr:class I SAM-dependent methyltransferase [Aetokthonos hydrillicola]MBO3461304.1 class I SAM-dependent methyltransferase [Aetokthonos hydrillicola CCALA 1050]MBW4589642.1 methyltransferase domain-containing protein [Aetokthonos hydrillicola CCALA 1050]MDR9899139.1 methyltransferase domain-containing protein [Aetokthonos hydrillicola Thurmond2011]
MSQQVFWDNIYAQHSNINFRQEDDEVLLAAMSHFGDVTGAKLLDLGCGDGDTSLYFASKGANVVAVDISQVAVDNLTAFCRQNNIPNLTAIQASAFDIAKIDKFDFVFGNMILHHLEPFAEFSDILRASILPGGKAFFHENSAFSDILIWFRNNLVGKFGIPKYGDDEEFPLMPKEVQILEKNFSVKVEHPELVFFGLASVYLLKGHFHKQLQGLDNYLFQFPSFRKYSYRQFLLLS